MGPALHVHFHCGSSCTGRSPPSPGFCTAAPSEELVHIRCTPHLPQNKVFIPLGASKLSYSSLHQANEVTVVYLSAVCAPFHVALVPLLACLLCSVSHTFPLERPPQGLEKGHPI